MHALYKQHSRYSGYAYYFIWSKYQQQLYSKCVEDLGWIVRFIPNIICTCMLVFVIRNNTGRIRLIPFCVSVSA